MEKNIFGLFNFDPEDLIYEVHFPQCPVVPGSVIVHSFMKILKSELLKSNFRIGNFNFINFVQPGEYRYSIEYDDTSAKCILYDKDIAVTKGTIDYEK